MKPFGYASTDVRNGLSVPENKTFSMFSGSAIVCRFLPLHGLLATVRLQSGRWPGRSSSFGQCVGVWENSGANGRLLDAGAPHYRTSHADARRHDLHSADAFAACRVWRRAAPQGPLGMTATTRRLQQENLCGSVEAHSHGVALFRYGPKRITDSSPAGTAHGMQGGCPLRTGLTAIYGPMHGMCGRFDSRAGRAGVNRRSSFGVWH
jgi:hypothetical protein